MKIANLLRRKRGSNVTPTLFSNHRVCVAFSARLAARPWAEIIQPGQTMKIEPGRVTL